MINRFPIFLAAIFTCLLWPAVFFAQEVADGTLTMPTRITVRDIGWSQITNTDELADFLLSVLETLVFVACFAFHPRGNTLRQDSQGWAVQASMFLFGLIGMFVGFLVTHHGYLIGFVIFGLGSLFRFRMASNSLVDGALLIMVTLVGLAVGLNLPVMALVATVAGCVTLWFVTVRKTTVVELKFPDDDALRDALGPAQEAFKSKGFKIVSTKKNDFKPVVEYVLSHSDVDAASKVPGVLNDLSKSGHAAKDWYVA